MGNIKSKPVLSDLFTFNAGRRNRKSFVLIVLTCVGIALIIVASFVIPAYLGQKEVMAMMAAGRPLPQPSETSILTMVMNVTLSLARIAVYLMVVVALWAAVAQRFHDLGYSGWTLLWLLVPLINLYFFYLLFFKPGVAGGNRFGPDPLNPDAEAAAAPA